MNSIVAEKTRPNPIPGNVPWVKGKSGNPGGRPKGLAALVRLQTKDGKELVEFHLKVLRGELTIERYNVEGVAYESAPSCKDRLEAAHWLADRGFGKVTEQMILQNPDGSGMSAGIMEAAVLLARELSATP